MIFVEENSIDLGISRETISRIPQIPNPECKIEPVFTVIKELNTIADRKMVTITWVKSDSINGGEINFMFSDGISSQGFIEGGDKFIATYHETEWEETWPLKKNPFEGVSSLLTSMATINKAAKDSGLPIQHVVVANKHTRKFFERMRENGIFKYADNTGNEVEKPQETSHGILYTTKYPIKGFDKNFGRFAINEAAELINQLRTV